ncbi:MAG: phage portal protein [Lachnospiraceae bacterium]|nr:phage portal protein [Lachnospiraceae bacterium]
MGLGNRLQHAWNAFMNSRDPTYDNYSGSGYTYRPDRPKLSRGNERSIVAAIENRIAIDVASLNVWHCKLDKNGMLEEILKSGLNNCLSTEANIDQTSRAFLFDTALSMLDEGVVAIVPQETTLNPKITGSYDINSMRTGKVIQWKPNHVQIRMYNEFTGEKEDIWLPKKVVAIVENPFYAVMNEPNSTLQRLIRKLNLLDVIDEQNGSAKLDLIIQLPYQVKSDLRKQHAEDRRKSIKDQLTNDQYGIAYVDSTEKITQLNRPVENNLMGQIEYLTRMLYSQLGITEGILDGTADEQTQLNYINRTVEPIISAIVDEMKRKFLTKTARSQGQTIVFYRDPFKLVPFNNVADIVDKFTRNEVMTSNEVRQKMGLMPSKDPKADELINSNIRQPDDNNRQNQNVTEDQEEGGNIQNGTE